MKKQSLRRYRYSAKRNFIPASLGTFTIGGLTLFILIIVIIRFAAPGAFIVMASPFWHVGTAFSTMVGQSASSFAGTDALIRERDQLAVTNAVLEEQNRILTTKTEDLQNLLGNRTEASPGILAGVLVRPPIAPYDVLIVDQGARSHVTLGATAYGAGGTPIGTVASVSSQSARITLYSNPGLETVGWVGDTRIPVTIKGVGSGSFTATLSKAAGAAEGQGVYTTGPGAVPIGVVAKIDNDPSSPNVELHIRPYLNPFSLTWVTIAPSNL